jgi:hypothetical protein
MNPRTIRPSAAHCRLAAPSRAVRMPQSLLPTDVLLLTLLLSTGCAAAHAQGPALQSTPSGPAVAETRAGGLCAREPQLNPLVTEWPASVKAHLETVRSRQPVAVRYDGCELTILDECKLPGGYSWKQLPLENDALTITTEEELESKLPINGSRLEGELERSGKLVIRTTVSGRFDLDETSVTAPDLGPCAEATHVVTSMNVGAFNLVSVGRAESSSEVNTPLLELHDNAQREEHLLREAGLSDACASTTAVGPARQCGSPIRLFLRALQQTKPKTRLEQAQRVGEVHLHIPLQPRDPARWTLLTKEGTPVCDLPCTLWMRPASGHVLRQSNNVSGQPEVIPIIAGFPVAPGKDALGTYERERGSPTLSRVAFWAAGAPALVFGATLTLAGALQFSVSDSGDEEYGFLVAGLTLSGLGGGLFWWYSYSQEASFAVSELSAQDSMPSATRPAAYVGVGPGYIRGTF